jgi:hypothetical protein
MEISSEPVESREQPSQFSTCTALEAIGTSRNISCVIIREETKHRIVFSPYTRSRKTDSIRKSSLQKHRLPHIMKKL